MKTWAIINGHHAARWHLAEHRSGEVYGGRFYALCKPKSAMYSIWGVSSLKCERPSEIENLICKRCERLLAKGIA